jgi:hypothetical protein
VQERKRAQIAWISPSTIFPNGSVEAGRNSSTRRTPLRIPCGEGRALSWDYKKALNSCFGPMFKRAVVTGYSSSLVTKGAVSAQRNSQPRPSLHSDIKVQEFAKPRFATCAVRVLAVLQFWGSCPACPPSARSRSLGSRIGQFFTSGGGHEILLSSV